MTLPVSSSSHNQRSKGYKLCTTEVPGAPAAKAATKLMASYKGLHYSTD